MIGDRELIAELKASGRRVTPELLRIWRANWILPPLTAIGKRQAGKVYLWKEPDIIARAKFAYDVIISYNRQDTAHVLLWLAGFHVPHQYLKRAWLNRIKRKPSWNLGISPQSNIRTNLLTGVAKGLFQQTPAAAVLNLLMILCGPLVSPAGAQENDLAVKVLRQTLGALRLPSDKSWDLEPDAVRRLVALGTAFIRVLENTDLLSAAHGDDLGASQKALRTVSRLIKVCVPNTSETVAEHGLPLWHPGLAIALGAPLFLIILDLIRSGCRKEIAETADRIEYILSTRQQSGQTTFKKAEVARFRSQLRQIWAEQAYFRA